MKRTLRTELLFASLAIVAALASTGSATTFVNDPFLVGADPSAGEYTVGPLSGQSPDGIQGENDATTWGGNSSNLTVSDGSLTHDAVGYANGVGGKEATIGVTGDTTTTRYQNRGIDGPTSSIMYMSGLINRGSGGGPGGQPATVNEGSYALMGFTNPITNGTLLDDPTGADGNMFGLTWGFGGDAIGNYDVVLRHRRNGTNGIRPYNDELLDNADPNQTYLVVLKFEFNTNGGANGNDGITYWVGGNGSGFDVSSEASATATAEATGLLSGFGFNTTSDLQRILVAQRGYEATSAFFDEARLGDTFASVTIPEPTTGALLMLAFAGSLAMRRRA